MMALRVFEQFTLSISYFPVAHLFLVYLAYVRNNLVFFLCTC